MYQVLIILLKTIFSGDAWWLENGNSFDVTQNELIGDEHAGTDRVCVNTLDFEQNLQREIGIKEEDNTQSLVETENDYVPQHRYAISHNENPSSLTESHECIDSDSNFCSQAAARLQHVDGGLVFDWNVYNSSTVQSETELISTFSGGFFDSGCAHSSMTVANVQHLNGDFDWSIYNPPTLQKKLPYRKKMASSGEYYNVPPELQLKCRRNMSNSVEYYNVIPKLQLPRRRILSSGEYYNVPAQAKPIASEGKQTGLNDYLSPNNEKKLLEVPECVFQTEDVWILQNEAVEQSHEFQITNPFCLKDDLTARLDIVCWAEGTHIQDAMRGLVKKNLFKNDGENMLKGFFEFNFACLEETKASQVRLIGNVTLLDVLLSLDDYISFKDPVLTHDKLKQLISSYRDREAFSGIDCLKFYYCLIHYLLHPNTVFILGEREVKGDLVEGLYRYASDLPPSMGQSAVSSMLYFEKGIDEDTVACISIMEEDNTVGFYSCSPYTQFLMVVTALIKGFQIEEPIASSLV